MLRGDLERLGFVETARVPTDGQPGVWGFYDAVAERTVGAVAVGEVDESDTLAQRNMPDNGVEIIVRRLECPCCETAPPQLFLIEVIAG